jgi:succinate-semialdehyde dehydrogenase/glutarate-semialdehyde dehydrogenase
MTGTLLTDQPTGLYIDGKWVRANGSATFAVDDPATGQPLIEIADAGIADARAAVDAAAAALPGWRATLPRERAEILRAAFDQITAAADSIAELIVRENGKPLADARAEITYAAEFFRWFSEEAVRLPGFLTTAPTTGRRIMEIAEPVGVSLLLAPWNLPAAMITRKIAPALAAGCTVVVKPSNQTPLTALLLAQLLEQAGVPAGVVNVIPTTRDVDVVADLLARGPVRALSFTGSTRVGKQLLRSAADRVLKCSMELGGNAPFIVFADADIDAAVEAAMTAKMRHNAEACTAANRFLVHASVRDEFSASLTQAMSRLRIGSGLDPAVQVGPMASSAARAGIANKVTAAVDAGAWVRTGGQPLDGPGFFYPPTVLDLPDPDAALLQEEIFGPVAPIVAFDTDEQAIAMANSVDVGLGSYVHTRDLGRALRTAEALEVGMVAINSGLFSDPAAPFGGVKESGIGREGGRHGLAEFLETKYINLSWSIR